MTNDERLSILVFSRNLDRYSLNLLRELERMGHRVNVVLEPRAQGNSRDWSTEISIVDRVKLKGRLDRMAAHRYAENINKYEPNICLCYTSRALSIALMARRLYGLKVVTVGTRGAIGGISAFYIQDWLSYLSPSLNAVICMSKSIKIKLKYEARRFYSRHPGRFRTIYPGYGAIADNNGKPQLRRRTKEETLRLLCVANDRPIKGLRVLLDALETHFQSTNWQLELVGQCGEAIKNRVRKSTILSLRVNLNGFRSDLPYFYQAAHIYIQPTLAPGEGIGNSIAEAMSFGLPIITSNVGGGTELIEHERSGLHFKSGDPLALARAIERLAGCPNLCNTLGIAAFDDLKKRFGLKNEAEGFLTVFRELIGEQRKKLG